MNSIDRFLNGITMYRLVVYVLGILVALSVVFSFRGRLAASPTELIISLGLVVISAYLVDRFFGRLFNVPTNMESSLISALILFLIVQPVHSWRSAAALVVAGVAASASKFVLAYHNKHVFNPAAFGASLLSLTGLQATTWWIGNSIFWPFSLILGLAVVRKVRRFSLFSAFVVVNIILEYWVLAHAQQPIGINIKQAVVASPLIFLSTIMLTEPATLPPRRYQQMLVGGLTAVLYVMAWHVGPLTLYPEVALLFGNILAFLMSPKFRTRLRLQSIHKVSDRVYSYVFQPEQPFKFIPGQYMDWTLSRVPYDSRGNRRTFTIASSPTEETVQIGLKYYEPASMFKATFEKLRPGDIVYGSNLAGNFSIKGKEKKKLAFVAGGIGITPFRSMIKYLTDQNIAVDIILVYAVTDPSEFAYVPQLKDAIKFGVRTFPVVTAEGANQPGFINAELSAPLLVRLIPDYAERIFYISGPNQMVDTTTSQLRSLRVRESHIKTDHFSGY